MSVQILSCEFFLYVGLGACPGKFLRIRPSGIEFESHFSVISQCLFSTKHGTFLISEN